MNTSEQEQILDQWLQQHRGVLFKVVRAYAFEPHDQEDLFQEIATQVWHSIPKYRENAKVTTWLYRVALYTAMKWSKKEKRHRDHHQTLEGTEHTLRQKASKNPQLDWLYEQISQLNKLDRSITLLLLDGYSYREIATTLGMTESHVGVKINRIKKHLTSKQIQDVYHELR